MITDHEYRPGNDVSKYLASQEHYQIVLLDMLRAQEISQQEYDAAVNTPKDIN
ncbi:MAG: hypothetical protein WCJ45_02205 [bacterium]